MQFKNRLTRSKTFLARSSFLSTDLQAPQSSLKDEITQSLLASSLVLKAYIEHVRPLGDLTVENLSIVPKALEHGEWPADYTISDHGMVECVFSGDALGPEPPSMVIDPNPMAQGGTKK